MDSRFQWKDCSTVDLFCSESGSTALTLKADILGYDVDLDIFTVRESTRMPPVEPGVCLPSTIDIEYTVSTVREWIQKCNLHGRKCQPPENPLLPTRVLDLGSTDLSGDITLLLSNGSIAPYIAQSYCWGDASTMIETTKDNLSSLTVGISWELFPQTFEDAIILTKASGIRYLWIDALCILHDDIEDWEKESAKMADIYSNSYLTIAATSGSDCFKGLFKPRWTRTPTRHYATSHEGQKISIKAVTLKGSYKRGDIFIRPHLHLAHDRFIEVHNADQHITDAPLLSRAWAFQERLLPPRTLHFHSEELLWECNSDLSCECGGLKSESNKGKTPGEVPGGETLEKGVWLKQWFTMASTENTSLESLSYVWLNLISEFSRLHLTQENDRMPALSGLAKRFPGKVLGSSITGIWERDLGRGLLFERSKLPTLIP